MKLKEFRTESKLTQKQLADALKVNQQTIARWEKGQTEPNIKQLRDLAMIFETSVDAILGKEKPKSLTPRYWSKSDNDIHEDYFYGYLGITLYEGKLTRWFPVTEKDANSFINLPFLDREEMGWKVFETLNNRFVAVNLKNITYLTVNHDDADEPAGDWTHTYNENMLPEEMYRGLEEFTNSSGHSDMSEKFISTIQDYMKEKKLTE